MVAEREGEQEQRAVVEIRGALGLSQPYFGFGPLLESELSWPVLDLPCSE